MNKYKQTTNKEQSRNCFMYGLCTNLPVNEKCCAEEISKFGLKILNGGK